MYYIRFGVPFSIPYIKVLQLEKHTNLLKVQQSVIEKLTQDMKAKDKLIDEVLRAGGMVLDMLEGSTEAERKQIAEIFRNLWSEMPTSATSEN